jgi:hypothetical protein
VSVSASTAAVSASAADRYVKMGVDISLRLMRTITIECYFAFIRNDAEIKEQYVENELSITVHMSQRHQHRQTQTFLTAHTPSRYSHHDDVIHHSDDTT